MDIYRFIPRIKTKILPACYLRPFRNLCIIWSNPKGGTDEYE